MNIWTCLRLGAAGGRRGSRCVATASSWALALAIALVITAAVAQPDDELGGEPHSEIVSAEEIDVSLLSYSLGYDLGRTLQQFTVDPIELDVEEISSGVSAALKEWESAYSEEEMTEAIRNWAERQNWLRERENMEALENAATKNLEEARRVAAENRKNRKVKETDSGLQYEVMRKGKGPKPKEDDWVRVHYVGTVPTGETFDSSRQRGEPVIFRLNEVIQGWGEGLQLMEKNATFRFHIPPHLAYGREGVPDPAGLIGPNKMLVFEVELLDFSSERDALAPNGGN